MAMDEGEPARGGGGDEGADRFDDLYLAAISVLLVGACIGYGLWQFPELPAWKTVLAGTCLGVTCSFVAATHRFLS